MYFRDCKLQVKIFNQLTHRISNPANSKISRINGTRLTCRPILIITSSSGRNMEKPTLPKETRDFGPTVMAKRQFIFDAIRSVFQNFGFQPLETPAMENLSTLTGKYGEEGDQLLFKVLNSGDFLKDIDSQKMGDFRTLTPAIAE